MMKAIAVVFTALMSMAPIMAQPSTWYVEQNGSGDFLDIQPAVDAAATGDTIMIGPGRFDTFHPFTAPAWTAEVIVGVTKDDLTFIGSGKDVTIIGTQAPGDPMVNSKCICSIGSFDGEIRDMTIENVEGGIYWYLGNLVIQNCVIRGNSHTFLGLGSWFDSLEVLDCDFELNDRSHGIFVHEPSRNISIRNCRFFGDGTGIAAKLTPEVHVSDCVFDPIGVGVQFEFLSTGSVRRCNFDNVTHCGINVLWNSEMEIQDVRISNSERQGIYVGSGSVLSGSKVVIDNTTDTSVMLTGQSYVNLTSSHIFPSSTGTAIRASIFLYDLVIQDFSGNYWGVSDADSIAAMIEDGNDDPSVNCYVQFLPFSGEPVPTKPTSWGSLKAMFR